MAGLNMTYDVYKANVINFLKENNCLERFNKNLYKQERSWEYLYAKLYSFHDTIDKAFTWASTPEGYDFWHKLHQKIQTYEYDPNILKDIWYD